MKESYTPQNGLELKAPSWSSHHSVKTKNSLTPRKKTDNKVDYAHLPARPSLWPISRIPCPSHLRDNYSQQPWKRTGPLKTVAFYIHAYIYLLFS